MDQETLFILTVMLKQFEDKVELVILSQLPVQLHTLHMCCWVSETARSPVSLCLLM